MCTYGDVEAEDDFGSLRPGVTGICRMYIYVHERVQPPHFHVVIFLMCCHKHFEHADLVKLCLEKKCWLSGCTSLILALDAEAVGSEASIEATLSMQG